MVAEELLEDAELLEWIDEVDEEEEERKKRRKLIFYRFLLVGILLNQAVLVYVINKWGVAGSDQSPETKERIAAVLDSEEDASPVQTTAKGEDHPSREHRKGLNPRMKNIVQTMPDRVQRLNGGIYRSVEAEIENNQVKNITIDTHSPAWDAMQEREKVDLLNKTTLFLKTHYPGVTPFVTLRFDGPDQDLKLNSKSLALTYIVKTFKQSFRDLNPEIYKAVDVEFEGDQVIEESGEVFWDDLRIKTINIHVYAKAWDSMQAGKRVHLINDTMLFLKMESSGTTPYMTLKFDDWRQDLKLKYKPLSFGNEKT